MSLLEAIKSRFSKRVGDYAELVAAELDGTSFDLDEAELILAATGRTDDDLARDAETLRQRRADVQTMAAAVDAKADISQYNEQAELLRAAFDDAVARLHRQLGADLDEIAPEVQRQQHILAEARKARQRLLDTAPDSLKQREAELAKMCQSQRAAIERLEDTLQRRRHAQKVAQDADAVSTAIDSEVVTTERALGIERDRLQTMSDELESVRTKKLEA